MRKVWGFLKKLPFHPNPWARAAITFAYIGVAIFGNFFVQAFCLPVWWAAILVLFFFISILIVPFSGDGMVSKVLYFFIGTGLPICLYCVIFLSDPWEGLLGNWYLYILMTFFLGLGLLAFLPFYLLNHIRLYFKRADKIRRRVLLAGSILPFIVCVVYTPLFYYHLQVFEKSVRTGPEAIRQLPRNYFIERILGIGFKYHTRICYWDGWRPPLHDPYLNTALWFTSEEYFPLGDYPFKENFDLSLSERITYYHHLFPGEPIRIDCPCSYDAYGESYFTNYGWDGYFTPDPPVKTGGN
jgi:hypothetical protein